MSYLRFEKTLMTNLEESLQKEILRTNRSGAYHCSTIVDCNTRKYHGLLVVPIPQLDDENHVLLSSLDETVVLHGAEFNLGLHKYNADNFSPRGNKYIREFAWERVPTTIYNVGGVWLKKEKAFVHHENRILIRYTLLKANTAVTLRLRPFLAFRSVREYTHENNIANKNYREVENGISMCMYSGYPDLYMQLNKKNEFVYRPDWYRGIEYVKELERGYDFNEDLFVPGYFEVKMKVGESIVFSGGIDPISTRTMKAAFEHEEKIRIPRDNFMHCMECAGNQFFNVQGDHIYILAGYPWFKCRARDLFVSLPGLTLTESGKPGEYEQVMRTARIAIEDFMADRPSECKIYEMEHPDVLLWAIWAIQQYAKERGIEACRDLYGDLVLKIMDFIRSNKHLNLHVAPSGLVSTNGRDKAVTWMNSTANGRPVVPRTGYVVEINALWYNALKFTQEMAAAMGNKEVEESLVRPIALAGKAFVEVFLNEHGYLYDYVDGDYVDWSVRPNMILAAALEYSPLNSKQQKKVLDIVTRELLTPRGLRSLSPKSMGYNPNYVGPQIQRDYAYHQGTVWPWLAGFYYEAYLKIYKTSGVSFVERQMIGFEDEIVQHCVGSIPELFDGNPPFKGRGAVAFAMNVAEILRTSHILKQYESKLEA